MAASLNKKMPDYQIVDGFCLPGAFCQQAFRDTVNFKPRPTDTFVVTYPKCGTTWTQQILGLLRNKAAPPENSLEYIRACPFMEFVGTDEFESMADPRFFKNHLPFNLAPYNQQAKYVCVVRNPKDCLVSYYHHTRNMFYDFAEGDFNDYFELFLNGQVDYGDYFDHVLSWYEHRNDANVLFLIYEEMKADLPKEITKFATFLGPQYADFVKDETNMNAILKYTSFTYMREAEVKNDLQKPPIKAFQDMPISKSMKHVFKYIDEKHPGKNDNMQLVRKGIVGDWRNNFTPDQNKRMNEKIEEKLHGTELLKYWKSNNCL